MIGSEIQLVAHKKFMPEPMNQQSKFLIVIQKCITAMNFSDLVFANSKWQIHIQFTNVFNKMGFSFISQQINKISFCNSIITDITMKQQSYQLPRCPICLLDLAKDIVVLKCGHCYHDQCISQSLEIVEKCPSCRQYNPIKDKFDLFYLATPISHEQSLLQTEGSKLIIQSLRKENQYLSGKNSILEHNMKLIYEGIAQRQKNIQNLNSTLNEQEDEIKQLKSQITQNIKQSMVKDSWLEQDQAIINELQAKLKNMKKGLNKKTQEKHRSVEKVKQKIQKRRIHSPSEKQYVCKKGDILTTGRPSDLQPPKQNVPKIDEVKHKKKSSKSQKDIGNRKILENFWCNKEVVRTPSQVGTTYNTKRA